MLYFVQAASGAIKIGFTNNWAKRFEALRRGTHEKLSALLVIEGSVSDEKSLLTRFAAHRLRGEWFNPAPELLDLISSRQGDAIVFPPVKRRVRSQADHVAEHRERARKAAKIMRDAMASCDCEVVAQALDVRPTYLSTLLSRCEAAIRFGRHSGSVERVLTTLVRERIQPRRSAHYLRRVAAYQAVDMVALVRLLNPTNQIYGDR